ncbi:MAG: SCP2 sterol-binding domain-containing protein [Myxococcota bacterium]
MATFPNDPVSPRVFMEDVVPALFAEVELEPDEETVDLRVGVVLEGEEGGEWTLHFVEGELGIRDHREEEAELTVIQSVADWRAALWEGRPPLVAEGVERIRVGGANEMRPSAPADGQPRVDPLKGISDLRGRIEMVIEGTGEARWSVGVLVGPGAVPDSPQATITLGDAEAEAIRTGALHPLEALISGQLQLDGDLGLILQLQAVAMTLSMATGGR